MCRIIDTELQGVIAQIASDGHYGVVSLDKPYQDLAREYNLAVISEETINRAQMMVRSPGGVFSKGQRIKIISFWPAIESLRILKLGL